MDRHQPSHGDTLDGGDSEEPAHRIGPYRVLKELGRGGQGVVYLAQHESEGKKVALKVLDALASQHEGTIARFRREALAAASLRHPGICGLVEAGVDSATPYLAMEYVEGETLAKRIASRRAAGGASTWNAEIGDGAQADADDSRTHLDRESILDVVLLFERAARAVHAAHEAGVTHRDLKPANIMVSSSGEPVVLDFGLAHHDDPGLDTLTRTGDLVGTPAYMSPEQLSRRLIRLDRRTDVWSLGVCLHEAVTLQRPFEAPTREGLYQAILTKEPPPASQINPLVPKDLDVVIQTALSKDRDRRYQTALDLAEDLRNVRARAPILARPPTAWSKVSRWARRNPAVATLSAAVFVALAGGLVVTTSLLARVTAEKIRADSSAAAEKAAKLEAETKRVEAEASLSYARKGNEILGSVFLGLDPNAEFRTAAELRDALRGNLHTALRELEGEALGEPRDVALLQISLGASLLRLRDVKPAIPILEKALSTLESEGGSELPEAIRCLTVLGNGYSHEGQVGKAITTHERALERSRNVFGDDHEWTLVCLGNLGLAYQEAGRFDEAVSLFEEVARKSRETLGPDAPASLKYITYLAAGYDRQGKLVRAAEILEKLLPRLQSVRGRDHPQTLECMNNLGMLRLALGTPDVLILEETLTLARERLGADHPTTLVAMTNLGRIYRSVGRVDDAVSVLESALPRMEASLGKDHANTLTCKRNLASALSATGTPGEALPLLEDLLAHQESTLGPNARETLQAMNSLGSGYEAAGQKARALEVYEETAKLMLEVLGPDDASTIIVLNNLAGALRGSGDVDRATLLQEQAAEGVERLGFRHENAAVIIQNAVNSSMRAGNMEKAEAWRRKWMAVVKERTGADSKPYGRELIALGYDCLAQDRFEAAETALREGISIMEDKAAGGWEIPYAKALLGMTLARRERYVEAETLLLEGYRGMKAQARIMPWEFRAMIPRIREDLHSFYKARGNEVEAARWSGEEGQ